MIWGQKKIIKMSADEKLFILKRRYTDSLSLDPHANVWDDHSFTTSIDVALKWKASSTEYEKRDFVIIYNVDLYYENYSFDVRILYD